MAKKTFAPKPCTVCGTAFTPRNGRQVTCCGHCSAERWRQKVEELQARQRQGKQCCPTCGQVVRQSKARTS